jgi:hypothetical protein
MPKLFTYIQENFKEETFKTDKHSLLLYVDRLQNLIYEWYPPSQFPEGNAGLLLCAILISEAEKCPDVADFDKIIQGLEQILLLTRTALNEKKLSISDLDWPDRAKYILDQSEGLHLTDAITYVKAYQGNPEDFQLVLSKYWLLGDSIGFFEHTLKFEISRKGWIIADQQIAPYGREIWRFKLASAT